ncbi:MAG: UrcA family protein [Pseudomonadota bacterium]
MKTRIIAAAAIATAFAAPSALAAETFEFDFDYSPVEVATEDGAQQTYEELKERITEECQPAKPVERIRQYNDTVQCVERTLDQAVAQMDQPAVTDIHEGRG